MKATILILLGMTTVATVTPTYGSGYGSGSGKDKGIDDKLYYTTSKDYESATTPANPPATKVPIPSTTTPPIDLPVVSNTSNAVKPAAYTTISKAPPPTDVIVPSSYADDKTLIIDTAKPKPTTPAVMQQQPPPAQISSIVDVLSPSPAGNSTVVKPMPTGRVAGSGGSAAAVQGTAVVAVAGVFAALWAF